MAEKKGWCQAHCVQNRHEHPSLRWCFAKHLVDFLCLVRAPKHIAQASARGRSCWPVSWCCWPARRPRNPRLGRVPSGARRPSPLHRRRPRAHTSDSHADDGISNSLADASGLTTFPFTSPTDCQERMASLGQAYVDVASAHVCLDAVNNLNRPAASPAANFHGLCCASPHVPGARWHHRSDHPRVRRRLHRCLVIRCLTAPPPGGATPVRDRFTTPLCRAFCCRAGETVRPILWMCLCMQGANACNPPRRRQHLARPLARRPIRPEVRRPTRSAGRRRRRQRLTGPTRSPTSAPTLSPTPVPSMSPTALPTSSSSVRPAVLPSHLPPLAPTPSLTLIPTAHPTNAPSVTQAPSTSLPTTAPATSGPTSTPTLAPTTCARRFVDRDHRFPPQA